MADTQTAPQRLSALEWAMLKGRALPFRELALPSAQTDGLPAISIDVRGRPDLERLVKALGQGGGYVGREVRAITGAAEGTADTFGRLLGVSLELKVQTPSEASILTIFDWPEHVPILKAIATLGAARLALRGDFVGFTIPRAPLPTTLLRLLFDI